MSVRPPEQVLNEQETRVIHLRDERKWTLRKIGEELGISRERVRQCHRLAKEKLGEVKAHGDEALCLLPVRAARIVQDCDLKSRADVRTAIEMGRIFWNYWGNSLCIDGKRTRNAGWQCWEHLHAWARLPGPVRDRKRASPEALKRPWGEWWLVVEPSSAWKARQTNKSGCDKPRSGNEKPTSENKNPTSENENSI